VITDEMRQAILGMHEKGMKIRRIARSLGISRSTVRTIIKGSAPTARDSGPSLRAPSNTEPQKTDHTSSKKQTSKSKSVKK
jgi:transposase